MRVHPSIYRLVSGTMACLLWAHMIQRYPEFRTQLLCVLAFSVVGSLYHRRRLATIDRAIRTRDRKDPAPGLARWLTTPLAIEIEHIPFLSPAELRLHLRLNTVWLAVSVPLLPLMVAMSVLAWQGPQGADALLVYVNTTVTFAAVWAIWKARRALQAELWRSGAS